LDSHAEAQRAWRAATTDEVLSVGGLFDEPHLRTLEETWAGTEVCVHARRTSFRDIPVRVTRGNARLPCKSHAANTHKNL
jgi:hypothetical protein